MKRLKDYINESKRFVVNSYSKTRGNEQKYANSEEEAIRNLPNDCEYFDIMDNSKPNHSEEDALVRWSGKGGYWANKVDSKDTYPREKESIRKKERQSLPKDKPTSQNKPSNFTVHK